MHLRRSIVLAGAGLAVVLAWFGLSGEAPPRAADPAGGPGAPAESAAASPIDPVEIVTALDSTAWAGRALTLAMFAGDSSGMVEASVVRSRAMDRLERAGRAPGVILHMPWPDRVRWLSRALEEQRPDWSRALLRGLGNRLPEPGSGNAGAAGLAVALSRIAVARADAEDGAVGIATPSGEGAAADTNGEGEALRLAAGARDYPLRDEAIYRLWANAEAAGDTAAALAWADTLVDSAPRSARAPSVRITRARSLLARGRPAEAAAEARLALPYAEDAALHALVARALLAQGRNGEAALELETLIGKYGDDPLAIQAMRTRRALGDSIPSLRLDPGGWVSLMRTLLPQAASGAVESMRAVAAADSLPEAVRESAAMNLVRYFYAARRYPEAEPLLGGLVDSPRAEIAREAGLIRARIFRNTGRVKPMEAGYRALMKTAGGTGATATWELGRELESLGRWKDAAAVYDEFIRAYPGHSHARDALFRRGFDRVRLGHDKEAVEDFRAAYRASSLAPDQEQAGYWLARTLKRLGREAEAREAAVLGAWQTEPKDYYGVRIREEFGLKGTPPEPPDRPPLTADEPLDVLGDAEWSDPLKGGFARGLALARLGVMDEARREWKRVAVFGAETPAAIQALALAATVHHIYPEAVYWAGRSGMGLPVTFGMRTGYDRLTFPAAYYGEVRRAGVAVGVEPEILWAVMRQESLYDPLAVSRAGAIGLLQIMPRTLGRITREAGIDPLPVAALYRSDVNVDLGARFFADRLSEFGGDLLPALASYNAGEAKAREWMERADGDSEEVFVECIGYPETYSYVRRIVWLAWVYRNYYTAR